MIQMYIYNHCPFCIKTRLVADLSKLDYKMVVLANDDEKAHIDRIGLKQVPFIKKNDGLYLTESDEICKYIANRQKINIPPSLNNKTLNELISKLHQVSKKITYSRIPFHSLNFDDFPTQSAKDYFINKKSSYIGNMAKLRDNPPLKMIEEIQNLLEQVDKHIQTPFINGSQFSWDDINIFPFLSLITIINDLIILPKNIKSYLKSISNKTNIKLY